MTGFACTRREDGIYVMRLADSRQSSVDDWYNQAIKLDAAHLAANEPIFIILDLSAIVFPTPYAVSRAMESAMQTPDELVQRVAIVVKSNFLTNAAQTFMQQLPEHHKPGFNICTSVEDGLAWLTAEYQHLID